MPRGDRTGPAGAGPMTGRGRGFCAGFNTPGFINPEFGRGFGRGRCFGWRAQAEPLTLTTAQEKKILEADLAELEAEKAEIEKQIKNLKS